MNSHFIRTAFIASLMALTGLASARLEPPAEMLSAPPNLEALLPDDFGMWRRVEISQAVLPAESELAGGEAVAYRAYKDDLGRVVTLVVAYGPPLGDSVRLHRPETCYVAQGFEILSRGDSEIVARGRPVPIVNLDTQSPARREAVSYWLRAGDGFTAKSSDAGWRQLKDGAGRLDGALLRISTTYGEKPPFDLHARFLTEFANALDPAASTVLLGREPAQ
jgi:EpsI family protein